MASKQEDLAAWSAEMERRSEEIAALIAKAKSEKARSEGLDDAWSVELEEKRDDALERLRRLRAAPEGAWREHRERFQASRRALDHAIERARAARREG